MGNVLMKQAEGIAEDSHAHRSPSFLLRGMLRWVVMGSMAFGGVMVIGAPVSAWAAGDVNRATCPNESASGFRASLPDCRAFELLSPPYKDGYFPFFEAVSPNGEHALFESLGTFGGAKGNHVVQGTVYESSRTSSGWLTKAVSPPASTFAFALEKDASRDLSRTLWTAHTVSESADAEDLYVREPDGSFVLIGPELPPEHDIAPPAPYESRYTNELKYAGASPGLSHVFFQILPGEGPEEDILWTGDKTLPGANEKSLYEYSGVGNPEPKLVGVSNDGRLHNNSEAELISQCGVELGGGGPASMYNAISSSGETVFFTPNTEGCENELEEVGTGPNVNEVYARIDESKTVDVSEPSHEDCEACATGSPSRAFFEGASQDGSKAFFLSEQNGLLPGAEGMNLYEFNFTSGEPHEKLVRVSGGVTKPEVLGVVRISEDGSHVYFVAKGVLASNQNANKEEATAGSDNLYVFDTITGTTSFIGILENGDAEDWKRFDGRPVQATPDGRFLIFPSAAHLTPDDNSGPGIVQLFEYAADTGELARISVGQRGSYFCAATGKTEEGYSCDGNTENPTYAPNPSTLFLAFGGKDAVIASDRGRVSENGSVVVFESDNPLTPQAVNSLSGEICSNVYEYRWNPGEGGIGEGNVFLVSDGQDVGRSFESCGSLAHGLDATGADVVVESLDRLVPQDTDTQRDIYVAREEGGFVAGASGPACTRDACQGSLSVGPQLFGAGSAAQVGGGNLPPPAPQAMVKGKERVLTKAQKLAKALAACGRLPKKKRAGCKSRARKKYGLDGRSSAARGVRANAANGGESDVKVYRYGTFAADRCGVRCSLLAWLCRIGECGDAECRLVGEVLRATDTIPGERHGG